MADKQIPLKKKTAALFNDARLKYLNEDKERKLTDDLVIREALKKYLE